MCPWQIVGGDQDSSEQPALRTVCHKEGLSGPECPEGSNLLPPPSGSDFKDITKVFWVFFPLD